MTTVYGVTETGCILLLTVINPNRLVELLMKNCHVLVVDMVRMLIGLF